MKAIETKYIPASNLRGSRIKACAEGVRSVTIPYPHDAKNPHAVAAIALAKRMNWTGTLVSGGKADQSGYIFCFIDSEHFEIA